MFNLAHTTETNQIPSTHVSSVVTEQRRLSYMRPCRYIRPIAAFGQVSCGGKYRQYLGSWREARQNKTPGFLKSRQESMRKEAGEGQEAVKYVTLVLGWVVNPALQLVTLQ